MSIFHYAIDFLALKRSLSILNGDLIHRLSSNINQGLFVSTWLSMMIEPIIFCNVQIAWLECNVRSKPIGLLNKP